ncbi:TPR repeat-containing protein [Methanobrevibacter ruminantium M1]|uniref:TPR repeat-containing protein n=2 Tax=Methanobrevibacter ruminantium TaxID=83816 RepID=D3E2V8_METRM|nr:TPR repeat-containing protein [Methanobrevibacter ruminantium M1]
MMSQDSNKNDINSYDFPSRVEKALKLIHTDSFKALDYFNEILDDFFKFTPDEIKENNLSSLIINSLNGKGSILNAFDKIDEAEECFDMVLNDFDSQDFTSLINKALILRKKGHLEESLDYYDEIAKYYPDKKELILAMKSEVYGELKIKLSDTDLDDYSIEAKDLIGRGLASHENKIVLEALDYYQKAIKADSSCKYLVLSLMDDVKREFFKLFLYEDIDIEKDEISKKKGAVLHYLFIQNNLFYAYMLNEEILEENKNDLFALNAMGMIFFYLDDCDLSIRYFDRCNTIDEKYLYPYLNKAIALARAKRFDEAKESFGKIKGLPNLIRDPNEEELDIFKRTIISNSIYSLGF